MRREITLVKVRNPKYVFLSTKVTEAENIFYKKPEYIYTFTKYDENDNKKTFISLPVAYCPFCHKMDLISAFFEPLGEKEVSKRVKEDSGFLIKACFNHELRSKYFKKVSHNQFVPSLCLSIAEEHIGDYISKCPSCGKDLAKIKQKALKNNSSYKDNIILNSYDVYKKEDKIIVNGVFKCLYPNTYKGKIGISFFNIYLSINLKTGHSYLIDSSKKFFPQNKKFLDCTYFSYIFRENIISLLFKNKKLLKEIKQLLLESKKIKNDFSLKELSIEELIYLNRFPDFSLETLHGIKSFLDCPSYFNYDMEIRENFLKFFRCISPTKTFEVMDVINKFKLPNKPKLRKIATKDPLILFYFYLIRKFPFKNYDIQFSLIEKYKEILSVIASDKDTLFFLKELIKKKGEANAFKAAFTPEVITDVNFLTDSAYMYKTLIFYEKAPDLKGSICDIHTNLLKLFKYKKKKNKTFVYTKQEKLLEDVIGDIAFVLPVDSYQLTDIGDKMHICVGSYDSRVFEKACTIITMIKNNKYIGCLEIRGTRKRLIQAKAPCNRLLQGEASVALRKYVEEHNISTNRCSDFTLM